MIKVNANILSFEVNDRIGINFSKDCKIDFEQNIPITIDNSDEIITIGSTNSITRDDSFVAFDGTIIVDEDACALLSSAIKDQLIYCGGYYRVNKDHEENGVRVLDDVDLLTVGLYLDDIYSDKTTMLSLKEESDAC